MNNNGKIKLELTPKEISILSKGLFCLIMNANEARNKIEKEGKAEAGQEIKTAIEHLLSVRER